MPKGIKRTVVLILLASVLFSRIFVNNVLKHSSLFFCSIVSVQKVLQVDMLDYKTN